MNNNNLKYVLIFLLVLAFCFISYEFSFKIINALVINQHGAVVLHANTLQTYIQYNTLPSNYLYYFFLEYFSNIFNCNFFTGTVYLLSISVVFKYFVNLVVLKNEINIKNKKSVFLWGILAFLSFSLIATNQLVLFFQKDLFNNIYLGTIPPNIWHNSTIIFLFPLAILLYYYSWKFYERSNYKYLIYIIFLILINIAIKPSFFFVFAIVYPILIFSKYRYKEQTLMVILSIISGLLMLGLQFYSIASDKILNDIIYNGQHSGIAIKFFSEWSLITKNVFIDILKSFAFPVIFSIIYFKNLKKDISFWYVFALFIVALLIWLFVIETGPRYSHANFVWQLVVCNYIWFLYSIMKFYKYLDIKSFKINIFDILIILVFMFHFFSGIYYGYYIVKIGDFL